MPSPHHNSEAWRDRDFRRYEREQQRYYGKVSEGEVLASIPKEEKTEDKKEEPKEEVVSHFENEHENII